MAATNMVTSKDHGAYTYPQHFEGSTTAIRAEVNRLSEQLLKGEMDFNGRDRLYVEFAGGDYVTAIDMDHEAVLFQCRITAIGRGAPASIRFFPNAPQTALDKLKVLAKQSGGPLDKIDSLIQRTFKELPQADQDKITERLNTIAYFNELDGISLTDRIEQRLGRATYDAPQYFLSWALKDYPTT